ncbi:MAG: hypothetical protein ACI8Z7_000083 [Candidatus Nanohaloarchaea archaeon]|jgi:hypothetical protein
MNLKILAEQLTLFAGVFLLVNIFFFIPSQYSIHFQTDICENISEEDFSTQNLPRTAEYYQASCSSVIDGWKTLMESPVTLKYHILPLIVALVSTVVFFYYRLLDLEFDSKGVQNWNERKP